MSMPILCRKVEECAKAHLSGDPLLALCVPVRKHANQDMCCVPMQGLPCRTGLPAFKTAAAGSSLPPFARPLTIAGGPGPRYNGGSPVARRQPPAAASNKPHGSAGKALEHAAPDAPPSAPASPPPSSQDKKRKLGTPTVWQPRHRGAPGTRAPPATAADQAAAGTHQPPGASRLPAAGSTVTAKKEAGPAPCSARAAGGAVPRAQASGLLGSVGCAASGTAGNSHRARQRRQLHVLLEEDMELIDLTGESDGDGPV